VKIEAEAINTGRRFILPSQVFEITLSLQSETLPSNRNHRSTVHSGFKPEELRKYLVGKQTPPIRQPKSPGGLAPIEAKQIIPGQLVRNFN
jgi:hypothetical protein